MDLSILIPARNEMFLSKTVEDLLTNIEGDTEIIVGLDGLWADPPISDHPKVKIYHVSESIGQRAMTNELCKLSKAKYVMKVDAHCAFDKGFDVKLMADMQDDWTVCPLMRNLHAFDWVCPEGHRRYQGPSGVCATCGKETIRDVVWIAKPSPKSTSNCFDTEPHFQYFGEFRKRPEGDGDLTESMSLQGSCFMMTRDKYWELNICDEEMFGSWGSQGIEVAVKTWLSGGRVIINHKTWYAHMFRTQGGDFGFPYDLSGKQVSRAKHKAREVFFNDKWDKAIHPLSWLIEKFWPIPGWKQEDLNKLKGIIAEIVPEEPKPTVGFLYYTDNQLDEKIMRVCQRQLKKCAAGRPIISVSLKPMDFGTNIVLPLERGYLTMFKQILMGLEALDTDIVYFCEHDDLYHPSHFDFIPPKKDVFYYNSNYWFLRMTDGFALHYDVSPLSSLCAYRQALITHYKERIALVEKDGFSYRIGFEPFTHHRIKWENWYEFEVRSSSSPNIDICHANNVTKKRWNIDQFRRKPANWQEATVDTIPGWDNIRKLLF